eukprot:gene178-237_t
MSHITSVKRLTTHQVYLLVPNLIGYLRALLAVVAFVLYLHPVWFVMLYGSSQLLDSVDGYAARRLKQSSVYGALLDMLLDRVCTASLLAILIGFYPGYASWLVGCIFLDAVSHFAYLYSALSWGRQSHKVVGAHQYRLLKAYYGSRSLLFTLCAGSEMFLLWLYWRHFAVISVSHSILYTCVTYLLGAFFLIKQVMNLAQLMQAIKDLVALDMEA